LKRQFSYGLEALFGDGFKEADQGGGRTGVSGSEVFVERSF